MIVKNGPCFNSVNSASAEIHLFTFFPRCGKRCTEGRHKKETRVRVSCAGRSRFSSKFLFAGASIFPVFFISEELKDDLSKNMLISGFGVAMKLAVFIFPVVWQLATPRFREVVDSNGNKLLVDSTGTVYSYGGNRIGEMIDHNKYVKY